MTTSRTPVSLRAEGEALPGELLRPRLATIVLVGEENWMQLHSAVAKLEFGSRFWSSYFRTAIYARAPGSTVARMLEPPRDIGGLVKDHPYDNPIGDRYICDPVWGLLEPKVPGTRQVRVGARSRKERAPSCLNPLTCPGDDRSQISDCLGSIQTGVVVGKVGVAFEPSFKGESRRTDALANLDLFRDAIQFGQDFRQGHG
jgi:hypothetical protein